mgnify:CR=1 FL=1
MCSGSFPVLPVTSTPGTGKTQLALPGCVAVTVYSNVPNRATRDNRIGRCVNAPPKSLGAAEVLAGAGVDLDLLAGLDEEGNLDLCAGLEGCGLGRVGSGVACKAGVGVGDYEVNEEGRLDVEDLALVGIDGAGHILFDELEAVVKDGLVHRLELVGFGVHEVVKVAVVVAVFHGHTIDGSALELCGGVEGSFGDGAGDDVFHLGAHESRALAGLNMLELDDLHDLTVHLKGNAVSEIACCNHNR